MSGAGPGAAGNVATEDLLYLLDGMGVQHGINFDRVLEASRFIVDAVGHPLTSKVYQAGGRLTTIRRRRASPTSARAARKWPLSMPRTAPR